MALREGNYSPQRWSGIEDQKARAALQEQAQMLARLARDLNVELDALALPGEIKMFADACPPGWSLVAALVDKFPRGASEGGGGATGGSDTHGHAAGTLGTSATVTSTTVFEGDGGGIAVPDTGHTHPITGSTASASSLPAYYTVVYCTKD